MIEENDNPDVYTKPFSVMDPSSAQDYHWQIDEQLSQLCKDEFKVLESKEDKDKKENAMLKMNEILKTWMNQVNKTIDNKLDYANSFARLLCFGSYKLGVSTPKGDIDAIVLAPNYVDRERHFFGDLYNLLMEYSKYNKNINDLTSVNFTHSITPLINLEFYGVKMDLLFANMDNVSQFDGEILPSGISLRPNLYNDYLMDHMDEKMKRSFNGFRNAEMILHSLVDENQNNKKTNQQLETFRLFLRCVKIFHKTKGIFENKFGYFGGITLAILAAKIFQMYPNYSAVQLLERYLYVYGYEWDWDDWKVLIVPERLEPSNRKNPLQKMDGVDQGQDNTFGKKKRFMEVMTPAYPQMSSTYNVNYSTRGAIIRTYQKFQKIAEQKLMKAEMTKQSNQIYELWKGFFEEEQFFINYDQFIEFIIVGNEEETYLKWKGFIEAKTRNFCEKIELLMNNFNFEMQIWPRTFSIDQIKLKFPYAEYITKYQYNEKLYIGLKLLQDYESEIDLGHYLAEFLQYIDLEWNSENQYRNQEEIDFYVYMIDRDDLELENLGMDIGTNIAGDLNELNRNKLEILNQNPEEQAGEILNDLLD